MFLILVEASKHYCKKINLINMKHQIFKSFFKCSLLYAKIVKFQNRDIMKSSNVNSVQHADKSFLKLCLNKNAMK